MKIISLSNETILTLAQSFLQFFPVSTRTNIKMKKVGCLLYQTKHVCLNETFAE